MPRPKENLSIPEFAKRLDWIVDNLDTDPSLLRFCNERNDVYKALVDAVELGEYKEYKKDGRYSEEGKPRGFPSEKTWNRAISDDSVPPIIINWILTLFHDMDKEWLTLATLDEFITRGQHLQAARARWRKAIEVYAKQRWVLEDIALSFYSEFNFSQEDKCPIKGLRLITQPGWIRSTPLELSASSEFGHLEDLEKGRHFSPYQLSGLKGAYISYKGSLTYRKRRKAKTEPQHNGEIFCVSNVQLQNGVTCPRL